MNDGYQDVLRSIASSDPTPGGGSVAALCLAHAHSLATMVSRLTLKSDKWRNGHDFAKVIIAASDEQISNALDLADRDAAAFDSVMAAYRMPKDEGSITNRSDAISEATIGAAMVPLQTIKAALELLGTLHNLSKDCNLNALTDLAASAELAHSAAKIADMNVRINIDHIGGKDIVKIDKDREEFMELCNTTLVDVRASYENRLGW